MCSEQLGCAVGCATCAAGSDSCTSCAGEAPLLLDGRCVASCGAGRYESADGVCRECDASCLECHGPGSGACSACDPIGPTAYLRAGACVLACGKGHYADESRVCEPCHGSCRTCTGPRSSQCKSCTFHVCARSSCPPVLRPHLDGSSCVASCPLGKYSDALSACRACSSACRACSGPSDRECSDPTPRTPFGDDDCTPGARRIGGRC
eukprot:2414264-Prymnesium_polylepis.1